MPGVLHRVYSARPYIILSGGNRVYYGAVIGTTVGTLSVTGVLGTPVFGLADNAGGQFALAGSTISTASALTLGTQSIVVSVAGVKPTIANVTIPITVYYTVINYDWPLPQPPRPRSVLLLTHTDSLKLNLSDQFFGVAGQPPVNNDWPNPRGAQQSVSLITHTNPGRQS